MNSLDFKAALIEKHFFLGCPFSYPDPVDIYIDGRPLAREVGLILFPPKNEERRELAKEFYYMYIPLSAQFYQEDLAKPKKDVLLFTCTCGIEACSSIWIDIVFDANTVVWTNWREIGKKPLPELPDLVFDKGQYLEAIRSLEKFINHQVKEFQVRIENGYAKLISNEYLKDPDSDRFRDLETDEWIVDFVVNDTNEIVYASWELVLEKPAKEIILGANEFLTKEFGLLIPGVYKLKDKVGSFWKIADYFAKVVEKELS
ncbi:hypothetical protein [Thermovibrio sp.]